MATVTADNNEMAGLAGPWSLSIVIGSRTLAIRQLGERDLASIAKVAGAIRTRPEMRRVLAGMLVDRTAALGLDDAALLRAFPIAFGYWTARRVFHQVTQVAPMGIVADFKRAMALRLAGAAIAHSADVQRVAGRPEPVRAESEGGRR